MKRIKKLIAAVSIFTLSISVMGCKMIEKTPEAIQKTVYATVGDEKITKADMDEEMKATIDQLKQQYGDDYANNEKIKDQLKQMKVQYLNAMVNEKLMLKNAESVGVTPTDDELNEYADKQIEQLKQAYPDDAQLQQVLEANGFTEDSYKDYAKKQYKLQKVQEAITADVEVTDDDAKAYYDENKDSQYTVGAGANAAHILIAEKGSDGNIDFDASLAKANEVKAKLDAGADFAQLASEYGTDGTKDKGGDLGFVAYNQANYDQDFLAGFKQLSEGQISDPIKSQFGYHIIKATGIKDEVVTPFDDVKEQIKSQLLQQQQSKAFNDKISEWKDAAKVKTYEDKL
ncbi:peptidylprolyl isomerase [Clostridium butyricum]|uniref:peptidylprolyl isomerase n=1 Tax=Clostridium butyricum E4 str. BoNT E BL5262 TaxID=632245 RepID=C4IMM0_CLOBU|nr:peptidylprolyl isomerase [Clostridium butyricum]APF23555.1 PPIC-type PPIASE domain protein [Clostridium butyricum]EDT73625.1 foldase protein PrsA [Clostridium butyricum 5521]EEP52549.1 putative peptidyl-prolyl cis-trans isomerase [Clostridium butyricum E4 str. BoNT E BL5262]NFL32817.1 peptidylprolyl isomerase [Clostridium butyricum]NFS20117.1 peptidylprolyl isomerase [Clostridium butyricum]